MIGEIRHCRKCGRLHPRGGEQEFCNACRLNMGDVLVAAEEAEKSATTQFIKAVQFAGEALLTAARKFSGREDDDDLIWDGYVAREHDIKGAELEAAEKRLNDQFASSAAFVAGNGLAMSEPESPRASSLIRYKNRNTQLEHELERVCRINDIKEKTIASLQEKLNEADKARDQLYAQLTEAQFKLENQRSSGEMPTIAGINLTTGERINVPLTKDSNKF